MNAGDVFGSFADLFDELEGEGILRQAAVWAALTATTAVALSVVLGDQLAAAVQVGLVAGIVTFVVLAGGNFLWQSLQQGR